MKNYLAAIDLADEDSWNNVVTKTVEMATGVPDTKDLLDDGYSRDHSGGGCTLRDPR